MESESVYQLILRMLPVIKPAVFYMLDVAFAALLMQISINILFNINFQLRRYLGIFLGLLGIGIVIGALFNQLFFWAF